MTDKEQAEIRPQENDGQVKDFIVHQLHHYGWTTNIREGRTFAEAAIADILAYHDFLKEGEYSAEYKEHDDDCSSDGRVVITCEKVRPVYGGYLYAGDYWFSSTVREGEADDCGSCGGSGVNRYSVFHQCWSCGDKDLKGASSGKCNPGQQRNWQMQKSKPAE